MHFIISLIIVLPLLAVGVAFALSNTFDTTVKLWPLAWQMTLPFYAWFAAAVLIGFIIGAIAAFFSSAGARRRARARRREIEDLRDEIAALRARGAATEAQDPPPPAPPTSALPLRTRAQDSNLLPVLAR